jgi:hypothetical protein
VAALKTLRAPLVTVWPAFRGYIARQIVAGPEGALEPVETEARAGAVDEADAPRMRELMEDRDC